MCPADAQTSCTSRPEAWMPSICRRRAVQTITHMPSISCLTHTHTYIYIARVQRSHTLRKECATSAGAGRHRCCSTAGRSADVCLNTCWMSSICRQGNRCAAGLHASPNCQALGSRARSKQKNIPRHRWPAPVGRARQLRERCCSCCKAGCSMGKPKTWMSAVRGGASKASARFMLPPG